MATQIRLPSLPENLREAHKNRLIVKDKDLRSIGYLVAVGNWILSEGVFIESIAAWRKKSQAGFWDRADVTPETTKSYLELIANSPSNRRFFLIFDNFSNLVGHVGLKSITHRECELDNLLRGASGGHPSLLYYAEIRLLEWIFSISRLSQVNVNCFSNNFLVIAIHEEVGFVLIESTPLKVKTIDGIQILNYSSREDANVTYTSDIRALDRSVFYRRHAWVVAEKGEEK